MAETLVFEIPPLPEFTGGSYRYFENDEKHITRIFKDFVLIFMLERTLYFAEDGKDITLEQGEWYMQIPGLKQEGLKGSPAPVYYYIHFRAAGKLCEEMGVTINPSSEIQSIAIPIRGKFDPHYFKPLFDQLENLSRKPGSNFLGKQAVFLNILNKLTANSYSGPDNMHRLIREVMDFLSMNYNTASDCNVLSERFHFSVDYITRKMKQYAGITPWQYIQQIRIDKSKELLENTDYSLAVIANSVGYGDLSVFYKAFKKFTGMAPGIWRQKNRGL